MNRTGENVNGVWSSLANSTDGRSRASRAVHDRAALRTPGTPFRYKKSFGTPTLRTQRTGESFFRAVRAVRRQRDTIYRGIYTVADRTRARRTNRYQPDRRRRENRPGSFSNGTTKYVLVTGRRQHARPVHRRGPAGWLVTGRGRIDVNEFRIDHLFPKGQAPLTRRTFY